MEIGRRIFNLRKHLGLNQAAFGKRIGVTRSAVCNYENCSRSVGEQVILAICREFNVSEEWLRTGEGDMSPHQSSEEELAATVERLVAEESVEFRRRLVKTLSVLREEHWLLLEEKLKKIVSMRETDSNFLSIPSAERTEPVTTEQEQTQQDIMAELAELKRQNQELAAKVAAMEEEDIANGLWDGLSASPSASVGKFSLGVKK